jgi:hypothetical protein
MTHPAIFRSPPAPLLASTGTLILAAPASPVFQSTGARGCDSVSPTTHLCSDNGATKFSVAFQTHQVGANPSVLLETRYTQAEAVRISVRSSRSPHGRFRGFANSINGGGARK